MSKKDGPLVEKYYVNRLDGKDKPGQSKEGARYFVLDYVNDPYATKALQFYAFICQEELPELSKSIWMSLRDSAKRMDEQNG